MEDQNTETSHETQRTSNPFFVPISIIIAGALISGAVIFSNSTGRTAQPQPGAANTGKVVNNAALLKQAQNDSRSIGSPDSRVTIVEFADFQCPFCGRFFQESEQKLIDQYVKTGKARFVYHDFAFLGPESQIAAEASRCAQDQNAFWQYHDYLYTHQKGENQGSFAAEHLKEFARTLKLDTAKFNSCLDAGTYKDQVQKDVDLGRSLGVDGTPAVFINSQFFNGALPFQQFQAAIDAERAK